MKPKPDAAVAFLSGLSLPLLPHWNSRTRPSLFISIYRNPEPNRSKQGAAATATRAGVCSRRVAPPPSRLQAPRRSSEMAMDAAAEGDHLAAERAAARFDVEEMKVAWAGSRHAVDVADRMARLVASDPVSSDCYLDPLPILVLLLRSPIPPPSRRSELDAPPLPFAVALLACCICLARPNRDFKPQLF